MLSLLKEKLLPPQTYEKMTKIPYWRRYGAKILAALRRVKPDGYGVPWCFQPVKT